jgi:aminoglycoside phosphotransferase family enzyme/predicted kinase
MSTAQPAELAPAVAETHISTVFFAGTRAYKLLKPIATPYLDYSRADLRLAAAASEVELNRRLSPDVYLGTADVMEGGELTDRFIVMRRMPASRRLSDLVAKAGIEDHIRSVARRIASFHASLPALGEVDDIAGAGAVRSNWTDNFDEMEPLVGDLFDPAQHERVRHLVDQYLTNHADLFHQRIEQGFVREGHGDLTADDIFCLDDGPRILDCLAFSRQLRVSDVLADIAFLAMDLDRLAGPLRSQQLLRSYAEFSNEHHPSSLAHHYVAYRAHVRAKVASLRHIQGDPGSADLAETYLDLAQSHLEKARLRMILVGGSPGTGKSTVASGLSDRLGFVMLGTDGLRKDLTGRGHSDHEVAPPDKGIYAPHITARIYTALLDQAALLLGQGESVILDASWNTEGHRSEARSLAEVNGAEVVELECILPVGMARERVAARLSEGIDPSDATPELLDVLRQRQEPWLLANRIDTSGTRAEAIEAAAEVVEPGRPVNAGGRAARR